MIHLIPRRSVQFLHNENKIIAQYKPWQWILEMVCPTDRLLSPIDGQDFPQEIEAFQLKVLQICSQCSIYRSQQNTENKVDHK